MSHKLIKSCRNWGEFQTRVSGLTNKKKGDAFEDLVALSFQITPKDKTKYKKIWKIRPTKNASFRIPEKLRKKLRLPEPDLGIDLLAETFEGEYHAVQCKYHSNVEDSVTKAETDSGMSLAFSQCKGISCFILATSGGSGGKRSRHLKDYATGKLAIRDIQTWQDLDESFFKAAKALIDKRKPPTAKPFTPRPHQKRAIKNALIHFVTEKNSRGKMIMPCGSGKSLTGYWIAQDIQAKRIVVAVPSLALVKQTIEVWAEQAVLNNKTVNWICVCSDKSIEKSDDDVPVQFQDLGVKVDTDPAVIAKWLKKRAHGIKVVFTTYQSGKTLADAAKAAKFKFDFGVLDEAHKTVGNKDKAFAHLLYEENIRIKKRLCMTATERRYSGSGDDILSMDNQTIYGETFELLSFKEALECKPPILCDYKILTIAIEEDELKEAFQKNFLVQPDKGKSSPQEIRMLTAALAARKAIRDLKVKHVISFHSSVARAINFEKTNDRITETLSTFGHLDTFHVSAQLNTGKRQKIIRDFADSKRSLITNARCLTEGVDIKQVDCVMFADRKKSPVDIVQATGRALRPFEGKNLGYVIIPILVSSKNTEKRIEESEEFQDVLMTLRALASNDDRIIEYFRALSEGARVSKSKKIFEVVGTKSKSINVEKLEKNIRIIAWEKLAKLSWRPFEEARQYVRGLNLSTSRDWKSYCKTSSRKLDIPVVPEVIYKNRGWINYSDWLGNDYTHYTEIEFLEFKKARSIVRRKSLRNTREWNAYKKSDNFPKNIPKSPNYIYKDSGWAGMGDWLGNGKGAWRSFTEARSYVRKLKIKTITEWRQFARSNSLPADIPKSPQTVYKDKGFKDMSDWLGAEIKPLLPPNGWMDYEKALKFVRSKKFKSMAEYLDFAKKNWLTLGLPINPHVAYKDKGWINIREWLGKPKIVPFVNYNSAKEFLKKNRILTQTAWANFKKNNSIPSNVPADPAKAYKGKGWVGWGEFTGSGNVAPINKKYRNFNAARKFVRSLKLKNIMAWRTFCKSGKLPSDIPSNPHRNYKDKGWKTYYDWIGKRQPKTYNFNQAKARVRRNGIRSSKEYNAYTKSPKFDINLPKAPWLVYKDKGWRGWGDFLDTGNVAPQLMEFRNYEDACKFAADKNIQTRQQWTYLTKSKDFPADIPKAPWLVYKDKGWVGMPEFLGQKRKVLSQKKKLSYLDARRIIWKFKLKSSIEFKEFTKSNNFPEGIPKTPSVSYYRNGWIGWEDWLGPSWREKTGKGGRPFKGQTSFKKYRKFHEARKFARSLKLNNTAEWYKFCKNGQNPSDIPTNPHRTYKDKGWKGFRDWLGKKTDG